jgi:hypothetical protein
MPTTLEELIAVERAQVVAVDSSLDEKRTPYMKRQVRFAGHLLDDATAGLGHATNATPQNRAMWQEFVLMNLQMAAQIRQKVQAAVEKFGGAEHVIEVGI